MTFSFTTCFPSGSRINTLSTTLSDGLTPTSHRGRAEPAVRDDGAVQDDAEPLAGLQAAEPLPPGTAADGSGGLLGE